MTHRPFAVLLAIAVVFFVWSALIFGGYVDFGNAGFLASLGAAALTASQFHLCAHRYWE